jgi:hypothetical protein
MSNTFALNKADANCRSSSSSTSMNNWEIWWTCFYRNT